MLEVLVVPGGGTFIDGLKPGIVSNFGARATSYLFTFV
jgi:hypothetical protein